MADENKQEEQKTDEQEKQEGGSQEEKKADEQAAPAAPPAPPASRDAEFKAESNKTATKITDQMLTEALGPIEVAGMLGSKEEAKARQHMLNWDDYHGEYKKPNLNKFPNNEDPFPADLKIEEFEAHWPNVKLYEVTCNIKAKEAAVAAMQAADAAEKRLIKLENNMATLMRLFFRLGTRVPINCVYYGGQIPNMEKYRGIRCMCDDRITDGQRVQIDQCLYCTRFEPIFGQCYELLNDTGMNVAAILDDNQMSYRDMKDFVANARSEKFMKEHEKTTVPATQQEVETRSPREFTFKDRWGAGIAMDWTYVPKEEQKCHINWRQSSDDDGSNIGRLGSWPYMYDRPKMQTTTPKTTKKATDKKDGKDKDKDKPKDGQAKPTDSTTQQQNPEEAKKSEMRKNTESQEKYTNIEPEQKAAVQAAMKAGQEASKEADSDDVKNSVACDWQNEIIDAFQGKKNIPDMLTAASIMHCTGTEDAEATVKKYSQMSEEIGTDNPAVIIPAMELGKEAIIGGNGLKPIWEVPLYLAAQTTTDSKGNTTTVRPPAPPLHKEDMEKWKYGDPLFVERLSKQAKSLGGNINLFPKVSNTYVKLEGDLHKSPYDDGEMCFPFTGDILRTAKVKYVTEFGTRTLDGETKLHRGVDLGCAEGTPFVAAHDGIITAAGDGWGAEDNAICLDHGNGEYTRYLHASEILCHTGQKVAKGEVIGKVGNTGNAYGSHLHFEFGEGDSLKADSNKDPMSKFPQFYVDLGSIIPGKSQNPLE